MSEKSDGPAFPTSYGQVAGLTLRDWFAGQALSGLASIRPKEMAAKISYEVADAMLAEREK
jgi:hypothetical protein